MLKLKKYQDDALAALERFLRLTRSRPMAEAFATTIAAQSRVEPYRNLFENVPSVCLRIPTGGGKTLLAAHAVARAGKALLDVDSPVALWLTPSDAIRKQTLEALSNLRHPYRQALSQHFGDRVLVCDLEHLQTIGVQDVGRCCIVVVATIQALNVSDTSKRNVYAFFEELAPHFTELAAADVARMEKVTAEDLKNQPFLTERDLGRVKYSVANWLHRQNPIIVVDEAHNNRTDRFFLSLDRLNPCCVLEFTATPVAGNNVLYHVAASELKAEEMIKLPIVLAEHPDSWQSCVRDALLTRQQLELAAQKEADYVRPLVLIQAQPKGGEATVDVVRAHLIEEHGVAASEIAVATGTQKELDQHNLFDPACPVRCVITVEALKEGWDCSFAYVLASLQSVASAKDVEQLLGRVLRMPYAKKRGQEILNRAYAHIVASNFAEAAANLKDRMVQNMGFERLEAATLLMPQQGLPLTGGATASRAATPAIPDFHIQLSQVPDTRHWPGEVKAAVRINPTSVGATVLVKGDLDAQMLSQAEAFVSNAMPVAEREEVRQQFDAHRAMRRALLAPAQLGVDFAPLPQLCLVFNGEVELVERTTLADRGAWNLLDFPVQLANFMIRETVNAFEIDTREGDDKLTYRHTKALQLDLNAAPGSVSEQDLVSWLEVETRQQYLKPAQLLAYLVKMVSHLTADRGVTLTALVRARHQLARAIIAEIERLRGLAIAKGFQQSLFEMVLAPPEQAMHFSFRFKPGQYPARNCYDGSYEFSKHFYPVIHDLREKTPSGRDSEEFICAQTLDGHPKVKHWVRNIERQEKFSFWLPTSSDYFYPDFVAELVDGRVLVVEYKGEPYKTNDDSKEKAQVGYQWEKTNNRHLFLFAVEKDRDGRDVRKQIHDKIG